VERVESVGGDAGWIALLSLLDIEASLHGEMVHAGAEAQAALNFQSSSSRIRVAQATRAWAKQEAAAIATVAAVCQLLLVATQRSPELMTRLLTIGGDVGNSAPSPLSATLKALCHLAVNAPARNPSVADALYSSALAATAAAAAAFLDAWSCKAPRGNVSLLAASLPSPGLMEALASLPWISLGHGPKAMVAQLLAVMLSSPTSACAWLGESDFALPHPPANKSILEQAEADSDGASAGNTPAATLCHALVADVSEMMASKAGGGVDLTVSPALRSLLAYSRGAKGVALRLGLHRTLLAYITSPATASAWAVINGSGGEQRNRVPAENASTSGTPAGEDVSTARQHRLRALVGRRPNSALQVSPLHNHHPHSVLPRSCYLNVCSPCAGESRQCGANGCSCVIGARKVKS
jgi:hypothetical protein